MVIFSELSMPIRELALTSMLESFMSLILKVSVSGTPKLKKIILCSIYKRILFKLIKI